MVQTGKLWETYQEFQAGRISRRMFLQRATMLGVAAPVALGILQLSSVSAQDATPVIVAAAVAPSSGTEGQTRGAGGPLKLLQWQAPTTLNMQLAGSFKDQLASCLVTEPLIHFLADGTPIPCLVKEIPTKANGLLAEDLTSVTYNLLEGVVWSDGEPFTANDVAYTWEWITNKENQSGNSALYSAIASIDVIDDLTVKINFTNPQLGWHTYFASSQSGGILPKHILSAGGNAANDFASKPIGTGPYVVDSYVSGDSVQYSINQNYREPNKPYFETVNLKGGGDAATAATAVLQTGDWDFGWNLLVDPGVLRSLAEGGKGDLVVVPGTAVEYLSLNFSDPNKEVDGQKSQWQTPHPFLTDLAVRQAMALGVDRQSISDNLYFGSPGEPPTSNVLLGIAGATSPNTTWEFNLEKGNALLEEAGWLLDGNVRKKDGVELKLQYATTVSDVRQKNQAVVKQGWAALGFEVELLQIDAAIFFDPSPGVDQNLYHMYWDLHEYAWSPAGPYPLSYFLLWVSHNGENIAQKENDWSQRNELRYNNPEFDALYDEAAKATDPQRANELFIQMNDILINDVAVIPIVQRASEKYGINKTLNKENIAGGPFDALYWNIANWNRVE